MKKHKYGHGYKAIGFIIALLAWDLITKALTDGINLKVIPGFFNFVSVDNTGGAWGILNQHTWILIVLTFLFLGAYFTFNYFFKQRTLFYTIGFSLVASGTIGNLFDRLFLGHVRDFISLDFIKFPVFNLADMFLCVGMIMLAVFFLFLYPKLNKGILKKNLRLKKSKVLKIFTKGSL